MITTNGESSLGLVSSGGNSSNSNTGTITITGSNSNGILSWGTGTANTNTGTITTSGDFANAIYSIDTNTTNTNTGTITTSGYGGNGFFSVGANSTNTNSGSITTSGIGTRGIYSTGANTTITNTALGSITTSGQAGHGIYSSGTSSTISNTGTITISGTYANAIYSRGANTSISNSGSITTSGYGGDAILSAGSGASNINSGVITTFDSANGVISYGINSINMNTHSITTNGDDSSGLVSALTSSNINSGSITTTGNHSYGIWSIGINDENINSGSITTSGQGARGIYSQGANTTISNSGSITTSGSSAHAIYSLGANTTINNSGSIRAIGTNSAAVFLSSGATNSILNLHRGSIIVGDIYTNSSNTGARLNINLGSGASYAYSVTGPWTVTDLDNRPMVTGSAYAAGIGAQETASEMLYQRTSAISKSLDSRLFAYAADEANIQPYWLDVYYSNVSRDAGANYSTRTHFSNDNYGMTVGIKLPVEVTPVELIVNAEHSNLNIDSGNQKVDSTGLMAGLLAPNLTEIAGAKLSAKALLGYANHEGDRKVMTNSLDYDGSRNITSDYDSYYAVVGINLLKLIPISDRLTASVLAGLDLNTQHIQSYAESDYFAWNSRTLTQVQSRIQAGLDYDFNDKAKLFARVGLEHRDLVSGETQNYSIHNTAVSFNTNNSNDTYLTGQLGVKAQLEKRIHLFGVLSGMRSSDTVSSIQGNIGLRADF